MTATLARPSEPALSTLGIGGMMPRSNGTGTVKRKLTVDEMLPPPGLEDVGGGDLKAIGAAMVAAFREQPACHLRPDETVLDIGCGIGRVAIPLTQYLDGSRGRYEGFDVMKSHVNFCSARITPSYPNFHFTHSDVQNRRYNPGGKIPGGSYRFPYEAGTFDFAFATSVFTHLLPEAASRYLQETARVLRPGGRFLATFFIIDEEARAALAAGRSSILFPHRWAPSCEVADRTNPEAAVAYEPGFIRKLFADAGLAITGDIGWGTWSGRTVPWGGYQDQIVAIR